MLNTRNGELATLITGHETRIDELTIRNTELSALITAHETRIAELTDRNAEFASLKTGHQGPIPLGIVKRRSCKKSST